MAAFLSPNGRSCCKRRLVQLQGAQGPLAIARGVHLFMCEGVRYATPFIAVIARFTCNLPGSARRGNRIVYARSANSGSSGKRASEREKLRRKLEHHGVYHTDREWSAASRGHR